MRILLFMFIVIALSTALINAASGQAFNIASIHTFKPPLTTVKTQATTKAPIPVDAANDPKLRIPFNVGGSDYRDMVTHDSMAHLHLQWGCVSWTSQSTPSDIINCKDSTGDGGLADRSVMYVPHVMNYVTGELKYPFSILVYYLAGTKDPVEAAALKPLPNGLVMVAGAKPSNSDPTTPDLVSAANWSCTSSPGLGGVFPPTNCTQGAGLDHRLKFKPCNDGRLDSLDHRSHMADLVRDKVTKRYVCPPGFDNHFVTVMYLLKYTVDDVNGIADWGLSVGNVSSWPARWAGAHGDDVVSMDAEITRLMMKNCINSLHNCGEHLLGDGLMLTPEPHPAL